MNLNKNKSSFDDLLTSLGFFGGVEFLKIITQIIRSKFIAVLLGPTGIGLYGLYVTTIGLTSTITNFGLDVSGVKFISSIKNTIINKTDHFNLFKSLIIISAFLGLIIVIIFSPILSHFTFQNFNHQLAFSFLSIYVFFNQLGHGNNTFLRALRQKKKFAKSNLLSSLFSLIISIIFYYYLGIKGIIPALVFSSLSYFIISQIINIENSFYPNSFSVKNSLKKGREILKMGITYSFSGLLIILTTLLLQIFIKYYGSIVEVGLFIAAISIVNNYVNLIFKAMSIDFFPKLSEIKSITKSNKLVNEQAILGLLLLSPILITLIIFIKPVLFILYSNDFFSISFLVQLLIIGIIFRTLSWSISYLFLSKGNTKLFFKNEFIFNVFYLTSNIISYKYFGLNGLGIAFILSNFFYLILVYLSAKNAYNFKIDNYYIITLLIHLSFVIFITSIDYFSILNTTYSYIVKIFILIISLFITLKSINSKSNILIQLKNKFWRK